MTQTPEKGERDGYAVFNDRDKPLIWAIGTTKTRAINAFVGTRHRQERTRIWRLFRRKHGFTVRPIAIKEIGP